jgi:hypothetical protein
VMFSSASLTALHSLKMAALQATQRSATALRSAGSRQQLVASLHAVRNPAATASALAAAPRVFQSASLRSQGRNMQTTVSVAR